MRQNSFSASEQIETSFLDFLESPGASRAEKVVKFCHHEGGSMQRTMGREGRCPVRETKGP